MKQSKDGTIIQFLQGSHAYEGVWFGENHPIRKGKFWWREVLREYQSEQDNWISVEERLPHCLELGNWDGRRSDFVIVEGVDGLPHIGRLYSVHIDGTDFNDWYDNKDWELSNIVKWKKINP
jgi:hypothetical protein